MPIQKGVRAPRTTEDWKENTGILTKKEDEETGNPVDKQENLRSKEAKHHIIKAVEEKGIQKRSDILHELDRDNKLILEKIEELKSQGILEVIR